MKISKVIVVEGKNDILAVKRAVDAFVISTSGSGLSKDLMRMLKKVHSEKGIIILTDPDGPGERIRSLIAEQIPSAEHAFIKRNDARLNGDIGIENASIEIIKKALENYISTGDKVVDLTFKDLIDNQLNGFSNSRELRAKLCDKLDITYANAKTLYKRLIMLNIDGNKLKKIMEEINGEYR